MWVTKFKGPLNPPTLTAGLFLFIHPVNETRSFNQACGLSLITSLVFLTVCGKNGLTMEKAAVQRE